MRRNNRGSTLMEILAVLVPAGLMAAGALGFFSTQNKTHLQQDLAVAMEENLRAAMGMLSDAIRAAGCGAPSSNLDDWISWSAGFTNDPISITSGGPYGDKLSVVTCTPMSVATVTAYAAEGATTLSVASDYPAIPLSDLFNASDKSLILIGDVQHAVVTSLNGGAIEVDTDPTAMGNQGLHRAFLPGTRVTRIDVLTFEVTQDSSTGLPVLHLDKHRGTTSRSAEGIDDLRVTTVVPGRRYEVTLGARSELSDPVTGVLLQRALTSDIWVRN
jgi:uncharacterized protein (DUF433 family)